MHEAGADAEIVPGPTTSGRSTTSTLIGWFLHDAYLYDWLFAIAAILVNIFVPEAITPVQRFYLATDPTLSFPYQSDTIPNYALYLIFIGIPIAVFTVVNIFRRSPEDWHHAVLSLAEGFAVTVGFKKWLNLTGVLRPDWLQGLSTGRQTTHDGQSSYPSGHASFTFFAMTITTLYLFGKFRIFQRGSAFLFIKFSVCIIPIAIAAFVAATRIVNFRHSPSDVNAGSFIGILSGTVCYFLNFPSLFSEDCDKPKLRSPSARSRRTAADAVTGERDDAASGRGSTNPGAGIAKQDV